MGMLRQLLVRWARQARRLFHMLVGLVFLFLATGGVATSVRLWGDYRRSPAEGALSFAMVAGFTVILFVFGLYSFAKARSIR